MKTARIDLRLTEAAKEALKEIALKDCRSITKEIEWLIQKRREELLRKGLA